MENIKIRGWAGFWPTAWHCWPIPAAKALGPSHASVAAVCVDVVVAAPSARWTACR
jgi:hypothetical protein